MRRIRPPIARYSEADLDFVVDTATPSARSREHIKRAFREDESFRAAIIADERVFQRVMADDEAFVRISPALYFEVLLRKAHRELEHATHTLERTGSQTVAVFDMPEVLDLLARPGAIDYLAEMLASFTRVESYVIPVRVRRGLWRKVRFNDTDIDSLMRLCQRADEEQRLAYYKRIADVCLFILGIFPEHAPFDYRHPSSRVARPYFGTKARRGLEDYETEGQRFYRLASEHPAAEALELAELFRLLHEKLHAAKKPLNFISQHYLAIRKQQMFGVEQADDSHSERP